MSDINRSVSYQIIIPPTVIFGEGSLGQLGGEAGKMGAKKALIVTDAGIAGSGLIQPVRDELAKTLTKIDVYPDAEPEPSISGLNAAAQLLRQIDYDIIIGLGGGSSIDTAKGLGVLLAHGGKGEDYIGTDKIPGPSIPVVAIPTTAGTGSEATNVAIFSDTAKELKVGMISRYLLAKIALVDPVLTYSCPRSITAASGMDALVHTIECYTSLKANDFTDAVAIKAMQLISQNLKTAVNDGANEQARCAMAEGALLAGIAFSNSSVAAVHALAYPLGARFHISHGMANGMLLPYVMKFNLAAVPARYAYIAKVLGEPVEGLMDIDAAKAGVKAIEKLIKDIGLPSRLRDLNVPKEALEGMALATMDVTRLLGNNPRTLTLADVLGIWQDAW